MTTTDSTFPRTKSGPSVHVVRARKLLYGGLAGGLAASIICLVVFGLIAGMRGFGSAALGAAMVLFFYAVGQLVMVFFADAGARTLLMVSMASYTARVVIIGLVLLVFSSNEDRWPSLDTMAVFITTIAVVAAWLVVEVIVFSRLRIGVYDTEYQDPESGQAEPDKAMESSS